MKTLKISHIRDVEVNGITLQLPEQLERHEEGYYRYYPSTIVTEFKDPAVSGVLVVTYPYEIVYSQAEYHEDYELYNFIEGEAVVLLCDLDENLCTVPGSEQIVKVEAGVSILLHPHKGHFAPIALGDKAIKYTVVAPKMDGPRVPLSDTFKGVF